MQWDISITKRSFVSDLMKAPCIFPVHWMYFKDGRFTVRLKWKTALKATYFVANIICKTWIVCSEAFLSQRGRLSQILWRRHAYFLSIECISRMVALYKSLKTKKKSQLQNLINVRGHLIFISLHVSSELYSRHRVTSRNNCRAKHCTVVSG